MARVLRRPMFRLGGNTDQGIMSGVAPRQGYANGDLIRGAQERKKVLSEMIGRPSDRSASDFWVDWGLGMVSGTPRGNIFATAAEQAKEPLQKFRETKAAEKGFQRQLGMVAAEAEMSHQDKMAEIALKNLTKDERIMMEKRAQLISDSSNGKISFNEALQMELFRKTEHPKEARLRQIEERALDIRTRIDDELSVDTAGEISTIAQRIIEGEFDDPNVTDPKEKLDQLSKRFDSNQYFIDREDIGNEVTLENGNRGYQITQKMPNGTYIHDNVYYNLKDQKLYRYHQDGYFVEYVLSNFGV